MLCTQFATSEKECVRVQSLVKRLRGLAERALRVGDTLTHTVCMSERKGD